MPLASLPRLIVSARAVHQRERARVRTEIARIPGLMSLLMKRRNGEHWSAEERALLREQLSGLGVLGLYLGVMAIPGTMLTLPLLAWWLDRRRAHRVVIARTASRNTAPATPPA